MEKKIFMSSIFKSGTWLLRKIVEKLTGMEAYEPPHVPGAPAYGDGGLIEFVPGHFFSWHSEINENTTRVIRENDAKAILLFRNIYDLALSMYHHLAGDIDSEIGRSTGMAGFFSRFSKDEGLSMVITGVSGPDGFWSGIGPHYAQIEKMLVFSKSYQALPVSYERLCLRKKEEICRIADYLDIPVSTATIDEVAAATDFDTMKIKAVADGGGSHFRRGEPGGHREALKEQHIYMIGGQLANFAPNLWSLSRELGFGELIQRLG